MFSFSSLDSRSRMLFPHCWFWCLKTSDSLGSGLASRPTSKYCTEMLISSSSRLQTGLLCSYYCSIRTDLRATLSTLQLKMYYCKPQGFVCKSKSFTLRYILIDRIQKDTKLTQKFVSLMNLEHIKVPQFEINYGKKELRDCFWTFLIQTWIHLHSCLTTYY